MKEICTRETFIRECAMVLAKSGGTRMDLYTGVSVIGSGEVIAHCVDGMANNGAMSG